MKSYETNFSEIVVLKIKYINLLYWYLNYRDLINQSSYNKIERYTEMMTFPLTNISFFKYFWVNNVPLQVAIGVYSCKKSLSFSTSGETEIENSP